MKVPSDEQPTAKQTSVTLTSPRRSSAIARSIRRVIRYPYGGSPYASSELTAEMAGRHVSRRARAPRRRAAAGTRGRCDRARDAAERAPAVAVGGGGGAGRLGGRVPCRGHGRRRGRVRCRGDGPGRGRVRCRGDGPGRGRVRCRGDGPGRGRVPCPTLAGLGVHRFGSCQVAPAWLARGCGATPKNGGAEGSAYSSARVGDNPRHGCTNDHAEGGARSLPGCRRWAWAITCDIGVEMTTPEALGRAGRKRGRFAVGSQQRGRKSSETDGITPIDAPRVPEPGRMVKCSGECDQASAARRAARRSLHGGPGRFWCLGSRRWCGS